MWYNYNIMWHLKEYLSYFFFKFIVNIDFDVNNLNYGTLIYISTYCISCLPFILRNFMINVSNQIDTWLQNIHENSIKMPELSKHNIWAITFPSERAHGRMIWCHGPWRQLDWR